MSLYEELIDDLEAGELSVEFEGAGAAGAARVGARALLAADRDLDRVPDRRRRVLLDMAYELDPASRSSASTPAACPSETYELIEQLRDRYPGLELELLSPDAAHVAGDGRQARAEPLLPQVEHRLLCCQVRKVQPLTRHLASLDAWITGLRRDQWATRTDIRKVEIDHDHGAIVKLNPLAEWTEDEVWDYVRERDVPYHPLYDRGYTSIGCAPCTRAIAPGEPGRDGRWWWETNAPKECGIHCAIETGGLEHELRALIGEDDE